MFQLSVDTQRHCSDWLSLACRRGSGLTEVVAGPALLPGVHREGHADKVRLRRRLEEDAAHSSVCLGVDAETSTVIAWSRSGFFVVIAEDRHTLSKYYFAAFWDSIDVAVQ